MAYTINLTNGAIFATIADGTINTSSSMTLVGKNYAGYGEFLDENFIHLLESGANTTPPGAPLTGQLWYDTNASLLKVYNGSAFKVLSAATAQTSAPSGSVTGDLWFDTVNQQLNIYNGGQYILVGPAYTSGTGKSGAIVETITDNGVGADHVVVKMYVSDEVVSIFSNSASFTPSVAITGFTTIEPGLTMSTSVDGGNAVFAGTATNSEQFGGKSIGQIMLRNGATTNDTSVWVSTDGVANGVFAGASQSVQLYGSGNNGYLNNPVSNGNLYIRINDGGVPTNAIVVDGSTGQVTIPNLVGNVAGGNISVYSITNLNANGVGNIGSSTGYFNTIFAKSTSAEYADVAERFAADETYVPGTIVEIGGLAEITRAIDELSENVFGVVSTRPAFTMNGAAGDDSSHPAIAMTGRVPVLCTGIVHKGDRLVCAGWGIARAAAKEELTPFNVIGRALTDKLTEGEGTVEAIVSIKN